MSKTGDQLGFELLRKLRIKEDNILSNTRLKLMSKESLEVRDCLILLDAIDQGQLSLQEVNLALEAFEKYLRDPMENYPVREEPDIDFELLNRMKLEMRRIRRNWQRNLQIEYAQSIKSNWTTYKTAMQSHYNPKRDVSTRENKALASMQKAVINPNFQSEIKKLRHYYKITSQKVTEPLPAPYDILHNWAISTGSSYEIWDNLQFDIEITLLKYIDYALAESFPIAVSFLFFDISATQIAHDPAKSQLLSYVLAYRPLDHVEVHVDDSEKFIGATLTVSYLFNLLTEIVEEHKLEDDKRLSFLDEIDNPMSSWINASSFICQQLGIPTDLSSIENAITRTKGAFNENLVGEKNVNIRITPDTRQNDIVYMWQKVIAERVKIGQSYNKTMKRSQFTRNSKIIELHNQGKNLSEIILYFKKHNNEFESPFIFRDDKIIYSDKENIKQVIKDHRKEIKD